MSESKGAKPVVTSTMDNIIFPSMTSMDDMFEDLDNQFIDDNIHIRRQARSGSKMITTIQNLPETVNKKDMLKAMRKLFACNGSITDHKEYGEVVQLQGDQCGNICNYLRNNGIATDDKIEIH
jgi:translation initiation factor 1